MGRDYPVELMLDTLYESGFAQTLSRFARQLLEDSFAVSKAARI
jgi:hypothetical protein